MWAILSSARGRQKRVANMCSVCARAGEEKKTQNYVFWELLIFGKIWLGKSPSDWIYLTMHMQWNQCWKNVCGKINVKSLIWFRGIITTTTAVWAILSSARGLQKRVANMCSVCARAGEEKKTQNFVFWELLIFRKVWLGKIDFRFIILDNAIAVESVLKIHLRQNQC